jgi:pyruvate dehydrogenase E2 component (dihydrolipoamide acetyltransferase)
VADFVLPSLGSDMDAGTVVEWLVAPGATVKRGDVVVVVETHKGAIEVEIWQDGTIAELLVPVGAEVPVGTALARVEEAGAPIPGGVGGSRTASGLADAAPPGAPVAAPVPAVPPPAAAPSASAPAPAWPSGSPPASAESGPALRGAPRSTPVATSAEAAGAPAPVAPPPSPSERTALASATAPSEGSAPAAPPPPAPAPVAASAPAAAPSSGAPGPSAAAPVAASVSQPADAAAPASPAPSAPAPASAAGSPPASAAADSALRGAPRSTAAPTLAPVSPPPGSASHSAPPAAPPSAAPAPRPVSAPAVSPASPPGPAWWVRSSPAARRRAAALGVDLRAIGRGSGPDGAVVLRDVPSSAPRAPAPPVPPGVDPMRLAIARAMERSNREIPHYYLDHTVDVSRMLAFVTAFNAERPVTARILPGLLFVRAVAVALRKFPDLHGFWKDDRHVAATGIHPAVAVSLRTGGLVVPALRDADQGDLADLMRRFTDLVQRARAGRLRASELYEATTTVTSLGERGVDGVYGVIYPPQVSLVGFGAVAERPWAVDGMLTVRPVVRVSLAGDHRASDGHRGGLFLARVAHLLMHPEEL